MADSNDLFARLLGEAHYKIEAVESEKVATSFFRSGKAKSNFSKLPIRKALSQNLSKNAGEGIHHIAFEVADIRAEIDRLEAEGFVPLNKEPKRGADNKLVAFLHPRSSNGVLVELCQSV
jgi:methylmalonyl-CoA/ethylmalonyl-CoA epimerase